MKKRNRGWFWKGDCKAWWIYFFFFSSSHGNTLVSFNNSGGGAVHRWHTEVVCIDFFRRERQLSPPHSRRALLSRIYRTKMRRGSAVSRGRLQMKRWRVKNQFRVGVDRVGTRINRTLLRRGGFGGTRRALFFFFFFFWSFVLESGEQGRKR